MHSAVSRYVEQKKEKSSEDGPLWGFPPHEGGGGGGGLGEGGGKIESVECIRRRNRLNSEPSVEWI